MTFKPQWTAEDIEGLWRLRTKEADEEHLRSIALAVRALCRMDNEIYIPETYRAITKEMRTPFVRDTWHRTTASLCNKPLVVGVEPLVREREPYRRAANICERADMALIRRWNKEAKTDLVYDSTAALVRDGESVLAVVHKPDSWANFPEGSSVEDKDIWKRGAALPFAARVVDRLNVLYEDGEWGDEWIMEYGEFSKPYLRAHYGYVDAPDGRLIDPKRVLEGKPKTEDSAASSTGRTRRIQFFTKDEWHVVVDGAEAPGYPMPNPYSPFKPLFRARAYDGESLLYSLLFLVPRLDELLTAKLNWSWLGAYPSPVVKVTPGQLGLPSGEMPFGDAGPETTKPSDVVKWVPGKHMTLPPGQELSFLEPPPVGKDLNDLVLIIKGLIDIAGIPSIMRGVSGSGDSGYLGAQLRAAAETAYKLAQQACERQWEEALEFAHWMVPNVVHQTVYVMGWSDMRAGRPAKNAEKEWLGWALPGEGNDRNLCDLGKIASVEVAYRPTLVTDEQARAMIALQLTNAAKPLYDRGTVLERFLQEEDPEHILDLIAVEESMQEEPLKSQVRAKALKDAGILKDPGQPGGLVDLRGNPLSSGALPMGPSNLGPTPAVPLANQAPPGVAGIQGLTMPLRPATPAAPNVMPGQDVSGMYPGQPGGPNLA